MIKPWGRTRFLLEAKLRNLMGLRGDELSALLVSFLTMSFEPNYYMWKGAAAFLVESPFEAAFNEVSGSGDAALTDLESASELIAISSLSSSLITSCCMSYSLHFLSFMNANPVVWPRGSSGLTSSSLDSVIWSGPNSSISTSYSSCIISPMPL